MPNLCPIILAIQGGGARFASKLCFIYLPCTSPMHFPCQSIYIIVGNNFYQAFDQVLQLFHTVRIIKMGGSESSSHENLSLSKDLINQYKEVRKQPFGTILSNKETGAQFLLKEYTYGSQPHFEKQLQRFQGELKQQPHENVLSICKVETREFNNFCSSSFKIYVIYEYPITTLKDQIMARQREGKYFDQVELWSILTSCTAALGLLKPALSLQPSKIFIIPDGQLKIIHNDMIQENYRVVLNDNVYYAPQKIRNFTKIDNEPALKKEAVFSMGMTILHAAQLDDAYSCYDYSEHLFIENQLEGMIESITERYSIEFIEMLATVLEPNPNRRASLMEVQGMLNKFWNNETQKDSHENTTQKDQQQSLSSSKNILKDTNVNANTGKTTNLNDFKNIKDVKETITLNSLEKPMQQSIEPPLDPFKEIPVRMSVIPYQSMARQVPFYPVMNPQRYSTTLDAMPKPNKQNLFTDPKLLEMIKKDLEDISKLKKSNFYETSHFPPYQQTESIMNSVKQSVHEEFISSAPRDNYINPFPKAQTTSEFNSKITSDFNFKTTSNFNSKPQSFSELNTNKPQYSSLNDFKVNMTKKPKENLVYAIQNYEDGTRYEGTILNGLKHGKGKLNYDDGAYYEGEFKQNKMNGRGILYYCPSKPAYDGEWLDDQFHGKGILFNQNPVRLQNSFDYHDFNDIEDFWVRYEGGFDFDNKSGFGKLYLSNGESIEGEFQKDTLNGQATFTNVFGDKINGIWEGNVFTSLIDHA